MGSRKEGVEGYQGPAALHRTDQLLSVCLVDVVSAQQAEEVATLVEPVSCV